MCEVRVGDSRAGGGYGETLLNDTASGGQIIQWQQAHVAVQLAVWVKSSRISKIYILFATKAKVFRSKKM